MVVFLFMIVAFFVGAIPTALVMGRAFRGIDIREHGSGNVGATNAFRVLGRRLGVCCLCLDILKGLLPVAILPALGGFRPGSAWPEILIGVSAVAGHVFSPFLGGRGGKGVATALGVFLIPGNYAFVESLGRKKGAAAVDATTPLPTPSHGGGH